MAYVAIRGGEAAIAAAAGVLELRRCAQGAAGTPLPVADLRHQLHLLVDRVCGEGGVWDPELAALAVKQAAGDTLEAAFLLRAHRARLPRLGTTAEHHGDDLRLERRVSAAFKEVPGGQVLGPTTDYLQRLFRFELIDEDPAAFAGFAARWLDGARGEAPPERLPKVVAMLRDADLLPPLHDPPAPAVDIAREPLAFPVPRPAWLAHLARGEAGGVLALAYSSMRGYGYLHPTVAELRFGWLPVRLPHPATGEEVEAGEVPITECEIVATHGRGADEREPPRLRLGYGACFGHQEAKAIAIAMLDRALLQGAEEGARHPAEDAEFVVAHVDGIESMGFCSHYKLPHYVTFQSDLENLRASRRQLAAAPRPDDVPEGVAG